MNVVRTSTSTALIDVAASGCPETSPQLSACAAGRTDLTSGPEGTVRLQMNGVQRHEMRIPAVVHSAKRMRKSSNELERPSRLAATGQDKLQVYRSH